MITEGVMKGVLNTSKLTTVAVISDGKDFKDLLETWVREGWKVKETNI